MYRYAHVQVRLCTGTFMYRYVHVQVGSRTVRSRTAHVRSCTGTFMCRCVYVQVQVTYGIPMQKRTKFCGIPLNSTVKIPRNSAEFREILYSVFRVKKKRTPVDTLRLTLAQPVTIEQSFLLSSCCGNMNSVYVYDNCRCFLNFPTSLPLDIQCKLPLPLFLCRPPPHPVNFM